MSKTPLYALHQGRNAKLCPFAGYEMPLYYPVGALKEHEWVRNHAGMFDVSHMGQVLVEGKDATTFFENVTPSAFRNTPPGRAKYTVLTSDRGGILDDIIVTRLDENRFFMVCNAARKVEDISWLKRHLPESVTLTELKDRALIAIQGPEAERVIASLLPQANAAAQSYMSLQETTWNGTPIYLSRLGYTGEDGFEVSIPAENAPAFWQAALEDKAVQPIGLAARDSLRLEAGYPLYGHDLTEETSPVEAALEWVIAKQRADYIGTEVIAGHLKNGVKRKRVGVKLTEKGVMREGCTLFSKDGQTIGILTSGGFSPSMQCSIGMGYVESHFAEGKQEIFVEVRGKKIHAITHALPFIQVRTKSLKKAS